MKREIEYKKYTKEMKQQQLNLATEPSYGYDSQEYEVLDDFDYSNNNS